MTNYRITRGYEDNVCAQETTNSIVAALEAAAIYLRDASCWTLMIEKLETMNGSVISTIIFDYYRP